MSALWTNWSWQDLLGVLLFMGIGAFLMTAALGLMFYKKWARYLMQLGFVIAGLAWLAFLSYNLSELRGAPLVFGGMTAAILGSVIGSLLFLNNTEWVLPLFQAHDERDGEVLDREFARRDEEEF